MTELALPIGESRVVLHGVSWEFYEQLLKQLEEQHVHLTYDEGELELMSPSPRHEFYKVVLARWIVVLAEELSLDFKQLGSMTFRGKGLKKGLEPDDCFWIKNEPAVRGKLDFDPQTDPPPDLALEIDITSSSLDREGIYASLGIRELWRYNGKELRVFHLGRNKKYVRRNKSLSFPSLPLNEFHQFFQRPKDLSEGAWVKSFRVWVRSLLK